MATSMRIRTIAVGFTLFTLSLTTALGGFEGKVCRGTSQGLTHHATDQERYEVYHKHYTNCTYVDGNLELIFVEPPFDYSFLQDIKEVTGYVLIVSINSNYIPLTSLRIIRGRSQYEDNGKFYSLYVAFNFGGDKEPLTPEGRQPFKGGLRELRFTSLYEILEGNVYFFNNRDLCHEETINWKDIMAGEGATVSILNNYDKGIVPRICPACHSSCMYDGELHCWGEGQERCQKFTKLNCSPQCEDRCFGSQPQHCCNRECAGGCTGPTNAECWACKYFSDNNSCLRYCPPYEIYDSALYKKIPNPNIKYTYGTLCMDKCPSYMKVEKGACVNDCESGHTPDENNVCVDCDGPCLKSCIAPEEMVSSDNIKTFKDCTIIKGNIMFLANTFPGDAFMGIAAMHPSELSVFETVREIQGFLHVEAEHPEFTNLSCFRNLEVIQGRGEGYRVTIYNSTLEALHLVKLREIKNLDLIIVENPYLCYANTVNWRKLTPKKLSLRNNRETQLCESEGRICDPECLDGCWGAGNEYCVSCAHYQYGRKCVRSCKPSMRVYDAGNKTCEACDVECMSRCTGKGPDRCIRCAHMKDGPFCVVACPVMKYADENSICQTCHANCAPGGCSGPLNRMGVGACHACVVAVTDRDGNVTECMPPGQQTCDDGFFIGTMDHGLKVCAPCHPECKTCTGRTLSYCKTCLHYEQDGKCVGNCTSDFYVDPVARTCKRCSALCLRCHGPTAADCITCKQYKLYTDYFSEQDVPLFNCTAMCPDALPYKITEENNGQMETICTASQAGVAALSGRKAGPSVGLIVGVSLTAIALLCGAIVGIAYYFNKRSKTEEKKMIIAARISGISIEEIEPLTPTNAKPDMTTLRLIKESELRRGNIIGSGAFGTVFKGAWLPEGENVKMPVAIKVLQEGTSPSQNQELLEEARIMFSVQHPCCSRVLAICLTAQMMLITQLMPLGCLLDYVRQHRHSISSKVLLNWCTQIAKGMVYLEDRGIVHRDLAARNVLVQNAFQVKITDFGLAKLLDYNEEEFHAKSGKMPIKWLALECIQHRIFTHKSDVWSYGVTLWELFTFGKRPYENVRARDMPDLLEKGERLPQPAITTIDIYMIMIKCWMLDAQSRPSFRELTDEFAKMSRDPGRYLVIQGDKFMRLPSQNYNTKDLIRNMSIADGPEVVVDAEEYLHPQSFCPEPAEPQPEPEADAVKTRHAYTNDRYADRPASGTQPASTNQLSPPQSPQKEPRYSGLESAAAARKQRDQPLRTRVSSRYSADPCRPVSEEESAERGDDALPPAPPTPIAKEPPGSKAGGGRLPFDEDDYLQPRSSNPAAYMDLAGDAKDYLAPEDVFADDDSRGALHDGDDDPTASLQAQNPEYFASPSSPPTSRPKDGPLLQPAVKLRGRPTVKPTVKPIVKPKPSYYNLTGSSTGTSGSAV